MNALRLSLALLVLLFNVATVSAAAQRPYALLHTLGTNGQAGAQAGESVAVDGNVAVAGASYYDQVLDRTDSGIVKVYDASTGSLLHTLTNPTPRSFDHFGYSVAVSGTRVVVGAYRDNTGANDAGSAYVYDLASPTPTVPVATLIKPSPAVVDFFGTSVAISGTRVAVGAVLDDAGTNNAGSVYVYDLASATPTMPVTTLTNPTPAVGDNFGGSVAISGTRVVVGAVYDDTGVRDAGSAYVFDLATVTPTVPVATLNNPGPATLDWFGVSVAISGTRVVVGAFRDDTGATDAGSAYVYDLVSATPTVPVATLTNPSPGVGDYFGFSVSISGTRVVVGAHHDGTRAPDVGSVYVYDLASLTPTVPIDMLNNPTPAQSDLFGFSVAVSSTRLVVGAPFGDAGAQNSGMAFIFGPRPALSLVPIAPGLAMLSWTPPTSSGFVLQFAEGLLPTNWLDAPSGSTNPVTIAVTNDPRFYRLRQP